MRREEIAIFVPVDELHAEQVPIERDRGRHTATTRLTVEIFWTFTFTSRHHPLRHCGYINTRRLTTGLRCINGIVARPGPTASIGLCQHQELSHKQDLTPERFRARLGAMAIAAPIEGLHGQASEFLDYFPPM